MAGWGASVLDVFFGDGAGDGVEIHLDLAALFVGAVDLPALALGHVQLFHVVLVAQGLDALRHLGFGDPLRFGLGGAGRAGGGGQRET